MKIRKVNVHHENLLVEEVYIYEDRKQEKTIVAIPQLEWSISISYEESGQELNDCLIHSLKKVATGETAEELARKIHFWVREMQESSIKKELKKHFLSFLLRLTQYPVIVNSCRQ